MAQNKYGWVFVILFIFALSGSLYIVATETNVVLKQPGTTFATTIRVHEIVGNSTGQGYIVLKRNPDTPAVMDYAKIDGKSVSYFTIAEGQRVTRDIEVSLPEYLSTGRYSIDYEIYLDGEQWEMTKSFRVV